jgi:DNA-binding LacI/PurR family transcriptional regulator/DNA-binding transcriptional regulator YhcF (GntR family)
MDVNMAGKRLIGINKAIRHLVEAILYKKYLPGRRLDSVHQLSALAGVAPATMWKAIDTLKAQGLCEGERGCRPRVTANAAEHARQIMQRFERETPDARASESLWRRIRSRIEKDILNGIYRQSSHLPSCKELQNRNAASYATVKKALLSLAESGLVVPRGSSYAVARLNRARPAGKILLIGYGYEVGKLVQGPIDEDFMRTLDLECSRMNMGMDVAVATKAVNGLIVVQSGTEKPYDIHTKKDIQGCIYMVLGFPSLQEEILRSLATLQAPVAIIDEIGGWDMPPYLEKNRYVKMFTATRAMGPGKDVGRFLLSLGHTHVAYISPIHDTAWSVQRLKGVVSAFRSAGHDSGVHAFTLEDRGVLSGGATTASRETERFLEMYNKWKKQLPPEYSIHTDYVINNISRGAINQGGTQLRLKPLFEKARADKRITAWVLANDMTAYMALQFLKNTSASIPQDLSLVSFDDSLIAMNHRLTSYNFNAAGMVNAILRYLLAPKWQPGIARPGVVEVAGTIVERDSTAAARGK